MIVSRSGLGTSHQFSDHHLRRSGPVEPPGGSLPVTRYAGQAVPELPQQKPFSLQRLQVRAALPQAADPVTIPLRCLILAHHRRRSVLPRGFHPCGFSLCLKACAAHAAIPRLKPVRPRVMHRGFFFSRGVPLPACRTLHDRAGLTSFFGPATLLGFLNPSQYSLPRGSRHLTPGHVGYRTACRCVRLPFIPTCRYRI